MSHSAKRSETGRVVWLGSRRACRHLSSLLGHASQAGAVQAKNENDLAKSREVYAADSDSAAYQTHLELWHRVPYLGNKRIGAVRVFETKDIARFARNEKTDNDALCESISLAERGKSSSVWHAKGHGSSGG